MQQAGAAAKARVQKKTNAGIAPAFVRGSVKLVDALGSSPSAHRRKRELAERDADVDALARTGECQRRGALGQHLRSTGLDHAGIGFALGIVAPQLVGAADVAELTGAVVHTVLADGEAAAYGDDIDVERASIVAAHYALTFGVLVQCGPAAQVELELAIDLARRGGIVGPAAGDSSGEDYHRCKSTQAHKPLL